MQTRITPETFPSRTLSTFGGLNIAGFKNMPTFLKMIFVSIFIQSIYVWKAKKKVIFTAQSIENMKIVQLLHNF